MPYPSGVNFIRCESFNEGQGKSWSNIFWFTTISTFPGTWNIATAAQSLRNRLVNALVDGMDATVKNLGINFLVHNAGLARSYDIFQDASGTVATAGSKPLPDDMSVVVSRLTTTPGRSGRGRLYFAGIPSAHVDENRVSVAGNSAWTSIVEILEGPFIDQTMTWSPANYSKTTGQFHAAIKFVQQPILGTRRDRKPRR